MYTCLALTTGLTVLYALILRLTQLLVVRIDETFHVGALQLIDRLPRVVALPKSAIFESGGGGSHVARLRLAAVTEPYLHSSVHLIRTKSSRQRIDPHEILTAAYCL